MHTSLSFSAALRVIFVSAVGVSALLAQGPVAPPAGPPAPTLKALDELEPRTNLQAGAVPFGVDARHAEYDFVINHRGSYYLSANLAVTKANGILINTEGVTLDLNGFRISRGAGVDGVGISIADNSHRTSISNGAISGFKIGIKSPHPLVGPGAARGCAFRDLAVSHCTQIGILSGEGAILHSCRGFDNTGDAIFTGVGSTLTNCVVSNNTADYGIYAERGSTLINCSAYKNTVGQAIFAGGGSTLRNCTAHQNRGTSGISAREGSTLTNCSAQLNTGVGGFSAGITVAAGSTIAHCTSSENKNTELATSITGIGFDVGKGTIQNCTASGNRGDGIRILSETNALENSSSGNGEGGDGAGIHSTSTSNRLEGNNVTDNHRGIDADVGGNLIIKNSVSGNDTNWQIAGGNVVLALIATPAGAFAGSGGGAALGSTNPNVNFTY